MVERLWALESDDLSSDTGRTSCVLLDKLLNTSESHFPHLKDGKMVIGRLK